MKKVILSKRFTKEVLVGGLGQDIKKSHILSDRKYFDGGIEWREEGLQLLLDRNGKEVCGILDAKSFWDALKDSTMAIYLMNWKNMLN